MRNHLGTSAWKNKRLQVLQRDGYICAYCGQPADQVDHVIPRVRGGSDALENLVAACRRCNTSKGDRTRPQQKAVFLRGNSTPPAFIDYSLPGTETMRPESPFDDPSQPE
jgi:5-methylcytosine-specific restriction endonuclease McrA